ncbi:MAG: hypothetical protein KTR32_37455 [Granulosicoccus sp.]|nr:hypothetical protein [Granulosicoccus sp.]
MSIMSRLTVFCCTAGAAFFLSGCGASNVVGAALGFNEADKLLEDSNGLQPGVPGVPSVPGSTVPPEDQAPISSPPLDLAGLFGVNYFNFSHENEATEFVLVTAYDSNSLDSSDPSLPFLGAYGDLLVSEDQGQTSAALGERATLCYFIDGGTEDYYMCGVPEPDPVQPAEFIGVSFFLLPLLQNGTSVGNFEFCELGLPTDECVNELFNARDGQVRLRHTSANAQMSEGLLPGNIREYAGPSNYASSLLLTYEQGSRSHDGTNSGEVLNQDPIQPLVESVSNQMKSLLLSDQ